jgi:hypothetical protein
MSHRPREICTREGLVSQHPALALRLSQVRGKPRIGIKCTSQFFPIGVAQVRTELEDLIQDLVGFEVGPATSEVHASSGSETPFFVEYDADTPTSQRDRQVTAAAIGFPARRSLGTVDPPESFICLASECRALEALSIRHAAGCFCQRFKHRLRALVSRAQWMKPQRRLALAKEIGNTLAKAQFSTLNGSGAAAAFGATACRRFKEMGHPGRIFQGGVYFASPTAFAGEAPLASRARVRLSVRTPPRWCATARRRSA